MKDLHASREQLIAEVTRLRTILRQSMDGFWIIDMDGNIREVNDAYCSLVGYTREELLSMRLQDVEAVETSEKIAEHIQHLTDAGSHRFETRHRRKDGKLVDLEASTNYLELEGGQIFALFREITERVQAEEKLRQRNRELALLNRLSQTFSATLSLDEVLAVVLFEVCQLLNVTSASIWLIDPETEELVCRQTADPRSELLHGWRLAPGEGLSGWAIKQKQSLIVADAQTDERHVNEVGLRTGLVLRSILTVPLWLKQEVIGVLQVVDTEAGRFNTTDLTVVEPVAASAAIAIENARLYEQAQLEIAERKSAEMALRESETRFRVMFEYSHDLLAVADESGKAIWANPAWRETLGYTQQMQGHLFEKVHPDDYRGAMEAWSTLERGEADITNLEYRYQTTWGNYVLLETTVTRLTLASRTYLYIAARDITKRVQAEEARQGYADRLENLHEIDLAILAAESPEAIAQATLPRLQKLVPFDQASVTVFDLEDLEATVLAVCTNGDTNTGAGIQVALDPDRIDDLLQGKVHAVEDSFAHADFPPSVQTLRSEGLRSSIAVPLIAQDELIGSLNLDKASAGAFAPGQVEIAKEVAGPLALAIQHARLFEEVRAGRERLRRLTDYLQAAREEERAHIAREIHDEFGQALTALKMDLAWITRRLPANQVDLYQKANSMSELIDTTIQMVRRVATELRPGLLDDLGLIAAIEWQTGEFSERTGIACELEHGDEILGLDTGMATVVFRIFQETLTNVARHAEASLVRITLVEKPEGLVLTVSDNGRGITPNQISDTASLGLIGMRERARSWGGDVKFQGIPGEGTTVTLRVPKVWREENENDQGARG